MDLTVTCAAPVAFALNSIDNKPGTAADNKTFGLGLTAANEKIGAFSPRIMSVEADGVTAWAIDSIDDGTSWVRAPYVLPNRLTSTTTVGGQLPIAVQNLSVNALANVWISPSNNLTLTDEVAFDGSATFEMKYL
ncbi:MULTISPECIES: hypothetical protein [unclassified Pseudomonas]|uniref:hypothetical protein n=1 Tax=unclassified Pseudomonas TaxID=196821 RepID=UPI0021156A44|nr:MULTISPECIES: hypothetical protein [unclassified Pseudomonas]